MKRTILAALVALVLVTVGKSHKAHAGAWGLSRDVNIPVLSFFVDHTYEYITGYGYQTWAGDATGGVTNQYTSTGVYSGTATCFAKNGNGMSYLWNGVCHQATNNVLYHTSLNWVYYWASPVVDGQSASYSAFCNQGASGPYLGGCWASPC